MGVHGGSKASSSNECLAPNDGPSPITDMEVLWVYFNNDPFGVWSCMLLVETLIPDYFCSRLWRSYLERRYLNPNISAEG